MSLNSHTGNNAESPGEETRRDTKQGGDKTNNGNTRKKPSKTDTVVNYIKDNYEIITADSGTLVKNKTDSSIMWEPYGRKLRNKLTDKAGVDYLRKHEADEVDSRIEHIGDINSDYNSVSITGSSRFMDDGVSRLGNKIVYCDNSIIREALPADISKSKFVINDYRDHGDFDDDGSINDLFEYLRLTRLSGKQIPLVLGWLVATVICEECPILWLQGSSGQGKSVTQDLLINLIDSSAERAGLPDDIAEAFGNSYIRAFDNANYISPKMSDIMCGSVTGMTAEKRKLYADTELVKMDMRTALVLSTTNMTMPIKGELVSRLCVINISDMPKNEPKVASKTLRLKGRELQAKARKGLYDLIGVVLKAEAPDNIDHRLFEFSQVLYKIDDALEYDGTYKYFVNCQRGKLTESVPDFITTLIENKDMLYSGGNKKNHQKAWTPGKLMGECLRIAMEEQNTKEGALQNNRMVIPLLEEYRSVLEDNGITFKCEKNARGRKIYFNK